MSKNGQKIRFFRRPAFKEFAGPVLLFLLGAAVAFRLSQLHFENNLDRRREAVRSDLESLRGDLSRELLGAVHLTEGLAGLITIEGGISEPKFRAFSRELFRRTDMIRHVALARGSVVIYVYPTEGNEKAVGLDYSQNEEQWPSVQRMMKDRRLVVAGPVKLVQGGIGVIGRTPIFVAQSESGAPSQFWGLSSTVIDFERLLAHTSMPDISKRLKIAMRGRDGLGAKGEVFYGEAATFGQSPILLEVPLPDGNWQIAGLPIEGWPQFQGLFSPIFLGGALFSLLLSFFMHRLLEVNRERLHEIRERRQAEAEMQLLRDVAIGVGVAEDMEQALRHVLIQICNTTEWDFAEIWIPDQEQNHLICYPAWFTRRPGMEEFRKVSLPLTFAKGEGFPGRAWIDGRPIVIHDLGDPDRFLRATAAVDAGLKSGIAVPVLSGDTVQLILCFYFAVAEELASSRVQVVSAVAAQVGLLIGRKKAEDEVRTLNQDLERRVAERTEELLAANRELEAFTYTVSHDLRAPLRAINGFSNLLSESNAERLDEKGRRYLYTIAEATRRMGQLIDDLLMFAKLNRQQIRSEPVSLDLMFDDMLEELRIIEGFRKVEIVRGELPAIHGDRLLIRQAFFNLLSNAFKFTRKRADARIVITGERQPGSVVISIADNGTGFDMKYANRLFGIFQRLHSEDDFEGTGVGLSIVHRVVHRHGGRVWFEATEGEGATFSVMLPVHGEPV